MSLRTVGIEFRVTGEGEATKALNRFNQASSRMSNSVLDGANKLRSIEGQWQRASQLYEEGTLNIHGLVAAQKQLARQLGFLNGVTTKAAMDQLKQAQAAREAENAAKEQARTQALLKQETESLARSYNPLMAATHTYEKRLDELNRAHNLGVLTQDELQAEIAQTRNAYNAIGNDANRASQFMHNFGVSGQFAGRGASRFGVLAQQSGYQIGDFLVQVQSGTNAFVAFGQQATQIAGTLTLLGGKWLLIGSVLGVAIPLITAAAAAFIRARGESKSFEDAISEAESAISSYSSAVDEANVSNSELRERFGSLSEEMRSLVMAAQELARLEAIERVSDSFSELEANITGLRAGLFRLLDPYQALRDEAERFGLSITDLQSLQRSFEAFRLLDDPEQQATQARLIAEFLEESFNSLEEMPGPTRELYNNLLQAAIAAGEIVGEAEGASANIGAGADEAARLTANLQQAASALSAIAGATISANIRAVGLRARTAALQSGQDIIGANVAGSIAEQRSRLAPALGSGDAVIRESARAELQQYTEATNLAAEAQRQFNTALEATRETGGGGGGGGDVFTSLIPGIEALAEAVRLANEQTQAYEQSVDILDDALQHGLITQQEYNTLLTQAQEAYGQAQTAAYDYQNAIEQISNTASSAMEDAFMSIVDGSATAADAFRNMAREILAEAFKMLVVRPIMNSLFGGGGGGFLGGLFGGVSKNEYGNAFHGGRVIPFANGGVVSSPTMFPMRGNQTGLMGEAGPEAIMPLKRGRDGKLGVQAEGGGGQSIVIHQSFNFQANGDESVKRIIAQEAPKIANLTQQQIIDQRKRGGVMKATF